jgi:hypothetical protein
MVQIASFKADKFQGQSLAERHENSDGRTEKRYTNHGNSRRLKQAITAGFLEQKDSGRCAIAVSTIQRTESFQVFQVFQTGR